MPWIITICLAVFAIFSVFRARVTSRFFKVAVGRELCYRVSLKVLAATLAAGAIILAPAWPTLLMWNLHGGRAGVLLAALLVFSLALLPGFLIEKKSLARQGVEGAVSAKMALAGSLYSLALLMSISAILVYSVF